MPLNHNEVSIIIKNSTNNLFLNNYLNMKTIINDVRNYIKLQNNNELDEETIINLLKLYRYNLLMNCYNKNNKEKNKFKEQIEWFYNSDFNNFSSALIQEKGNIHSLNRILNHYNDEGKFIYNQKHDYYYSALRLDNNKNFLEEIYKLYISK